MTKCLNCDNEYEENVWKNIQEHEQRNCYDENDCDEKCRGEKNCCCDCDENCEECTCKR